MDSNQLVWLFCEWDKLLPQSMSNFLWGKPIYICPVGPAPQAYELRKKNNQIWVDLKQVVHRDSEILPNYDADIVMSIIEDFGVTTLQMWDISSGLVGMSHSRLQREVSSHDNSFIRLSSTVRVKERLSSILGIKADRIGFVGSQTIGLEKEETTDLDIVVNLPVSEMQEFENKIWKLKRQNRHLQKKKFGMHFPYKLVIEDDFLGQSEIDIFPKALDPENHLLAEATEWIRRSGKQRRKFCVKDVTLGAEGWPVLFSESSIPIIILCNGFKGVFKVDDVVTANCCEVDIHYADHVLNSWVIDDPFRDIENAKDYFRFREERS